MMTTLMLIASGILIGAGISIIARDIRRDRRKAFVVERESRPAPDTSVKIVGAERELPSTTKKPPRIEKHWAELEATIATGVDKINTVLSLTGLSISQPGEAGWSFMKEGFGTFRRVLLGNELLARLRVELTPNGTLSAYVRSQGARQTGIDATASSPAQDVTPTAVADLLSACLKPTVAHVARIPWNPHNHPGDWGSIEDYVVAAVGAVNRAFAQAGARLAAVAGEPRTGPSQGLLSFAVEVGGIEVARLRIELLAHEVEAAVGVRQTHLIHIGRRRRIALAGMTTHTLAELIAGCCWPAIAHHQDARLSL
jgi:hypothetical protein